MGRTRTLDVRELGTPDMGDPRAVGTTGDLTGSPKEAPMNTDSTSVVKQQLYRLYAADGELLYVGISYSAIARYAQHKANQPWASDVARIEIETHECSRREIEQIERDAIIVEQPRHNVTHNVRVANASVMPVEFDATCMIIPTQKTGTWTEAVRRLDWLARDLDAVHSVWPSAPTRADFLAAINGAARSLVFGDCCETCAEICYPIALRYDSATWVKCGYVCIPCNRQWSCGWSADLALLESV